MTFRICKHSWFAGGWFFIQDSWFAKRICGRSQAYYRGVRAKIRTIIMNNQEKMQQNIGRLISNLQSLEFVLRLFLVEINRKRNSSEIIKGEINNYKVGEEINENPFTNYDSLKEIINKVNAILLKENIKDQIDLSLVNTRDAFAHGRISSLNPEGPFRLLKFSKPIDGKVKVTMSFDITLEWLSDQINKTYSETIKLGGISEKLGLKFILEKP